MPTCTKNDRKGNNKRAYSPWVWYPLMVGVCWDVGMRPGVGGRWNTDASGFRTAPPPPDTCRERQKKNMLSVFALTQCKSWRTKRRNNIFPQLWCACHPLTLWGRQGALKMHETFKIIIYKEIFQWDDLQIVRSRYYAIAKWNNNSNNKKQIKWPNKENEIKVHKSITWHKQQKFTSKERKREKMES